MHHHNTGTDIYVMYATRIERERAGSKQLHGSEGDELLQGGGLVDYPLSKFVGLSAQGGAACNFVALCEEFDCACNDMLESACMTRQ